MEELSKLQWQKLAINLVMANDEKEKRIQNLESAMQEFVDMAGWFNRNKDYMSDSLPTFWSQLEEKINSRSENFKELLEEK